MSWHIPHSHWYTHAHSSGRQPEPAKPCYPKPKSPSLAPPRSWINCHALHWRGGPQPCCRRAQSLEKGALCGLACFPSLPTWESPVPVAQCAVSAVSQVPGGVWRGLGISLSTLSKWFWKEACLGKHWWGGWSLGFGIRWIWVLNIVLSYVCFVILSKCFLNCNWEVKRYSEEVKDIASGGRVPGFEILALFLFGLWH